MDEEIVRDLKIFRQLAKVDLELLNKKSSDLGIDQYHFLSTVLKGTLRIDCFSETDPLVLSGNGEFDETSKYKIFNFEEESKKNIYTVLRRNNSKKNQIVMFLKSKISKFSQRELLNTVKDTAYLEKNKDKTEEGAFLDDLCNDRHYENNRVIDKLSKNEYQSKKYYKSYADFFKRIESLNTRKGFITRSEYLLRSLCMSCGETLKFLHCFFVNNRWRISLPDTRINMKEKIEMFFESGKIKEVHFSLRGLRKENKYNFIKENKLKETIEYLKKLYKNNFLCIGDDLFFDRVLAGVYDSSYNSLAISPQTLFYAPIVAYHPDTLDEKNSDSSEENTEDSYSPIYDIFNELEI